MNNSEFNPNDVNQVNNNSTNNEPTMISSEEVTNVSTPPVNRFSMVSNYKDSLEKTMVFNPINQEQNVSNNQVVNNTPVITPINNQQNIVNPQEVVNNPVVVNPVENTSTMQQVDINNIATNGNEQDMINEPLKKVETNYSPPSKLKMILLILFFIILIGFVIFLPDINEFMAKFKANQNKQVDEVITTGRLLCSLESSTSNLDKSYDLVFAFSDSKLTRTDFTITTRGDATLDEATLDDLASTCEALAKETEKLDGVNIRCNYSNGKLIEKQSYQLTVLDPEKLSAAFIEAGGNNPEYQKDQDINIIEKNMNASGYKCVREK